MDRMVDAVALFEDMRGRRLDAVQTVPGRIRMPGADQEAFLVQYAGTVWLIIRLHNKIATFV